MEISEDRIRAAVSGVEEKVVGLEEWVGPRDKVLMRPEVPFGFSALGALDVLESLGLTVGDRLADLRRRLETLGATSSPQAATGGETTYSSAASLQSAMPRAAHRDPAEAERQLHAFRARIRPPEDESPAVVPLSMVLGASDVVSVVLVEAHLYQQGAALLTAVHGRGTHAPFIPTHPRLAEVLNRPPASVPTLSMTTEDGRTARAVPQEAVFTEPPDLGELTVAIVDEHGNDRLVRRTYWLTPPPPGPLTVRFAWPEQALSQTTHRIELQAIPSAPAPRLWPGE